MEVILEFLYYTAELVTRFEKLRRNRRKKRHFCQVLSISLVFM